MSILLRSGVAVQVWRQAAFRRHPSLVADLNSEAGELTFMTPSWKRIKKIKRLGLIAFINMEDIAQKEFIKYVNLMNYTFENGHQVTIFVIECYL